MNSSTYLARLTPPGTGAIATLALRGPDAWDVLRATFRPARTSKSLADFFSYLRNHGEPGEFWFGHFGDPSSATDEVVLSLRRTTPIPWFEIHCHGGQQVVAMLEEVMVQHGVSVCSWQELYRQSTKDEYEVLATEALTKATTSRTARILLDQFHGAFVQAVVAIIDLLREDKTEKALTQLQELQGQVSLGRHLTKPWRVAIGGAPNVGKSSLINLLAGYQRSVVSATPGTTRDAVSTNIAIEGWPIEIIDTAGFRDSPEVIEKEGIDLAVEAMKAADLPLWVVDGSTEPVWPVREFPRQLVVINKVDLDAAWHNPELKDAVRISAKTGVGLDKLCEMISRLLVPNPPESETPVPFTEGLCVGVEKATKMCLASPDSARSVLEEIFKGGE